MPPPEWLRMFCSGYGIGLAQRVFAELPAGAPRAAWVDRDPEEGLRPADPVHQEDFVRLVNESARAHWEQLWRRREEQGRP